MVGVALEFLPICAALVSLLAISATWAQNAAAWRELAPERRAHRPTRQLTIRTRDLHAEPILLIASLPRPRRLLRLARGGASSILAGARKAEALVS